MPVCCRKTWLTASGQRGSIFTAGFGFLQAMANKPTITTQKTIFNVANFLMELNSAKRPSALRQDSTTQSYKNQMRWTNQ